MRFYEVTIEQTERTVLRIPIAEEATAEEISHGAANLESTPGALIRSLPSSVAVVVGRGLCGEPSVAAIAVAVEP